MKTYLYEHHVPFQDTDMAGVVHFTRIISYVELAEHACLAELGVQVISAEGGLPKVRVECDYLSPLRFGDTVSVHLNLDKCSAKSLHWSFEILNTGKLCARGKFITAYVNANGKAIEIPKSLQSLLK